MTNWLYGLDGAIDYNKEDVVVTRWLYDYPPKQRARRIQKELETYEWFGPWAHLDRRAALLYGDVPLAVEEERTAMNYHPLGVLHVTPASQADVEVAAELAQRKHAELVAYKLRLVSEYTEDNFLEGQVIRFRKKFDSNGRVYLYAAIKAGGKWYMTGRATSGVAWQDLVLFLTSGDFPVPFKNIEFLDTVNATPHAVVELTSASPYEDEDDRAQNVAAPYEPNEAWPIRPPLSNEDDDKTWQNRLAGAKGPDDDPDFDH